MRDSLWRNLQKAPLWLLTLFFPLGLTVMGVTNFYLGLAMWEIPIGAALVAFLEWGPIRTWWHSLPSRFPLHVRMQVDVEWSGWSPFRRWSTRDWEKGYHDYEVAVKPTVAGFTKIMGRMGKDLTEYGAKLREWTPRIVAAGSHDEFVRVYSAASKDFMKFARSVESKREQFREVNAQFLDITDGVIRTANINNQHERAELEQLQAQIPIYASQLRGTRESQIKLRDGTIEARDLHRTKELIHATNRVVNALDSVIDAVDGFETRVAEIKATVDQRLMPGKSP